MNTSSEPTPSPRRWALLVVMVGVLVVLLVAWSRWVPEPVPELDRLGAMPIADEGVSVDFTPDGRKLLVAGRSGSLQICDMGHWSSLVTIRDGEEDSGKPRSFYLLSALSPEGDVIASGDALRSGDVRVFDASLGVEVARLSGTGRPVALRFAPDGKTLTTVAGVSKAMMVKRWDTKTWAKLPNPIPPLPGAGVPPALSPDTLTLAQAGDDPSLVTLWDVTTGAKRADLKALTRLGEAVPDLCALAFAPSGRMLAAGYRDGSIRLWDLPAGTPRATLAGPRGEAEILVLQFTPDGRSLVAHESRVEDTPTPLASALQRLVDPRRADAPGPSSLMVWDLATGRKRAQARGAPSQASFHIAIAPNGRTLATIEHSQIIFWDIAPHPSD